MIIMQITEEQKDQMCDLVKGIKAMSERLIKSWDSIDCVDEHEYYGERGRGGMRMGRRDMDPDMDRDYRSGDRYMRRGDDRYVRY